MGIMSQGNHLVIDQFSIQARDPECDLLLDLYLWLHVALNC